MTCFVSDPSWYVNDLAIQPGSTLRAYMKEVVKPVLYIKTLYNGKELPLLQSLVLNTMSVSELRGITSRKTGLPVGVFRILSPAGKELFDCQSLEMYDITEGDLITVETWDGWSEYLQSCVLGFTSQVMSQLSSDEVVARYQMKVAMYLAAHFGNVDLAVHLIRQGIRPDEPVGEHPLRQWCKNVSHIDSLKTPIHESAESGQLGVLRTFVNHNVCTCLARDGNDLTPLNLALRNQQRPCASFLLTKQWSRIGYNNNKSISLTMFTKMKKWATNAKGKVLTVHGQWKSSVKHPRKFMPPGALVGHGVQLDGFTPSKMTTKSKLVVKLEEERSKERERKRKKLYEYPKAQPDTEGYFKQSQAALKLPKVSRYQKLASKPNQPATKTESDETKSESKSLHQEVPEITNNAGGVKQSRPRSRSGDGTEALRLPPIKPNITKRSSLQNLASNDETDGPATPTTKAFPSKYPRKGVYVHTPGKSKRTPSPEKSSKVGASNQSVTHSYDAETANRKMKRFNPLSKSVSTDTLSTPRMEEEISKETLQLFERYRGSSSKEYAMKCLSVAENFKELPWLHQVRIAMAIAAKGVKKAVIKEPHLFAEAIPPEPAPIESRPETHLSSHISSVN